MTGNSIERMEDSWNKKMLCGHYSGAGCYGRPWLMVQPNVSLLPKTFLKWTSQTC